jgi:hypothetical protein
MNDVDAGPVVGGYGMAASGSGIGAARTMGRAGQAYTLAAQALVASWPLPDGTLLVPRVLSNVSDAPCLGEVATLFAFTRRAATPLQGDLKEGPPARVYLGMSLFLALGLYEIAAAWRKRPASPARPNLPRTEAPAERAPPPPRMYCRSGRTVKPDLCIGLHDDTVYMEELEELRRVWLKYRSDVCYCD